MEGVVEDDFCVQCMDLFWQDVFDCVIGVYWYEGWGFDGFVWEGQVVVVGVVVGGLELELELGYGVGVWVNNCLLLLKMCCCVGGGMVVLFCFGLVIFFVGIVVWYCCS